MSDIWFTADTHFGHKAMARTGKGWRPFDTVEEHDETLISNWNSVVRKQDTVWHLGDVGLGDDGHTQDCVQRCNGVKYLVAGNHDPCWPGHRNSHHHQMAWLVFFDSVQAFARIRLWKGQEVMLSHFPYAGDRGPERYTQYRLKNEGLPLLHGHVHDAWADREQMVNVGVDVRDWRPINLDEVRELVRAL